MAIKFPSMIRLPKNKRFTVEPRYYDPIKEEIEERTRRIKEEMTGQARDGQYTRSRIVFERKTQSVPSASFLQLLIAAALGLGLIGWLYYGNDVLYALWLAVPVYLYYRFRKPASRQ